MRIWRLCLIRGACRYVRPRVCSVKRCSWLTFGVLSQFILRDELPDLAKEFPGVHAWLERLGERESVKKVKADRARLAPLPGAPPASGQGK